MNSFIISFMALMLVVWGINVYQVYQRVPGFWKYVNVVLLPVLAAALAYVTWG